jgi:hypothetical protein
VLRTKVDYRYNGGNIKRAKCSTELKLKHKLKNKSDGKENQINRT